MVISDELYNFIMGFSMIAIPVTLIIGLIALVKYIDKKKKQF